MQGDAARRITGNLDISEWAAVYSGSGALNPVAPNDSRAPNALPISTGAATAFDLDSARVTPTAGENRPVIGSKKLLMGMSWRPRCFYFFWRLAYQVAFRD